MDKSDPRTQAALGFAWLGYATRDAAPSARGRERWAEVLRALS